MVTMEAFQDPHLEEIGWENFLGMTVGQAVVWAAQDIDPKYQNPELTTSEPYVMGSHATCSGAWCSGPEDLSPPEYFWGYNRMMTVDGLFAAGDAAGGTAHAFSSGSFTEEDYVLKLRSNILKIKKLLVSEYQIVRLKNSKKKCTNHLRIILLDAMRSQLVLYHLVIYFQFKVCNVSKKLWMIMQVELEQII